MQFQHEFQELKKKEGFYSNKTNDRGGETIYGIARRRWPGWPGWKVVDQKKLTGDLNDLKQHVAFLNAVEKFYMDNFWVPSGANRAPNPVATLLWDAAVQHGVERSVIILQQALNVLNNQATRWPDLVEDGDLGPKTEEALIKACIKYKIDAVWSLIVIRGAFYFGLTRRDQTQEEFYRGWLVRVRKLFLETLKEE